MKNILNNTLRNSMKVTFKYASYLILFIIVLFPVWGQVANAQEQKPGHELIQTLLELYSHADYKVRQQAYFVSAGLPPYPEITAKLRALHQNADASERAVIRYVLAVITRTREDIEAFLNDFPLDRCTYNKSFYPYYEIEFMVLQVQFFLRELAYEEQYAERAKYLFWVAFYNPDMVHPRGPVSDILLQEYRKMHDHSKFILKNIKKAGVCNDNEEYDAVINILKKPLLCLTKSDDVATRSPVQGMIRFLNLEDISEHCVSFYEKSSSNEELFIIQNSICPFSFNNKITITYDEEVYKLYEFIKQTYNNPWLNFIKNITPKNCIEYTDKCVQLNAIYKYGVQYLNAYEKCSIANIFNIKKLK